MTIDDYYIKKTNPVFRVLIYIFLAFWLVVNLFPLYWMFTFSLKTNPEIYGKNVVGLPQEWHWEFYKTAMERVDMIKLFANSIIVAVITIVITIIVALMATYALTRLPWRGRKLMNSFFMLGLTIPLHAALVPLYKSIKLVGLFDTMWALIIPYAAFSLAMAILISTGFMGEIPKDLDEAACIDGCGVWGTFIRIIVPLMTPALATIGIYTFLQCWNEFLFASTYTSSFKTIPVGVQQFFGQHTTDWGVVGAALVIATFPTLLIYVFLSRKIQESFMAGAIKG
ncbi:MAG: carbohydrate ABC transporter permease [Lachnospiraceae bacterium]|nr:carbohydrate ABC transporter permease [Lachnospiraceae bacterium]